MQWEEVAAVLSLSLTGMLLLATLGWLRRIRRDAAAGYLLALLSLSGLQALEYLYHQQQWFHHWPHLLKLADPLSRVDAAVLSVWLYQGSAGGGTRWLA